MSQYIKSHSNYVLKKRHQEISDGTIWERDITTIGGVNQFAAGQIPIYKSSNFIITVRNDGKKASQFNQTKWTNNEESGDTWTLEALSGMTSEYEDQNDVKIVLKQDYYDFCDFAYYGSLSEMFRASINDVLKRFPGELYGTSENAYYTTVVTSDFDRIEERVMFGKKEYSGNCKPCGVNPYPIFCEGCDGEYVVNGNDKYVDNPYGIDIHSVKKPLDGKELKYFANKGYKNYEIIEQASTEGEQIESWKTRNFLKVVKDEEVLDCLYGDDAFYYNYLKPNFLKDYFENPDNEAWWIENDNDVLSEKSIYSGTSYDSREGYDKLVQSFENGDIHKEFMKYKEGFWVELHEFSSTECGGNGGVYNEGEYVGTPDPDDDEVPTCDCVTIKFTSGPFEQAERSRWEEIIRVYNEEFIQEGESKRYVIKEGAKCGDIECYFATPCKGNKAASVTAETSGGTQVIIGAWIGDNDEIVYLSDEEGECSAVGKHIRPIEKFISKFYNECDNFEKIIVDNKTTPLYSAIFSVIKENERGYYRELETFTFPTSYGNYNLDASSFGFTEYTTRFAEIGEYYDELFTDNLYRSMTHEAIKNFDWTYTREFTYGDEEEYVRGGEKVQKALRIFAREFDEILTYINNIKNTNRITYDERSNIPDYFLIDQAESKGWDVCLVYPYDLEEYYMDENNEKVYIKPSEYKEPQQLDNKEGDSKIVRQFSQNAKKEINPYSNVHIENYPFGYFVSCDDGDVPCWYEEGDVNYKYLTAKGSGNTYYEESSGKLLNRVKSFSDERSYTYLDANNEFMRRLVINSPYIWRHKGTIEGIEMILAMFGLKSKRWVDRKPLYRKDICDEKEYDYEIVEYSSFAKRIEEKWDAVHQMYRIDWVNSTKSIVYDNRNTSNYTKYGSQGDYMPYQGLPVTYRDVKEQCEWDDKCNQIKLYKDKEFSEEYSCECDENDELKCCCKYKDFDPKNAYKKPINECYIEVSPLEVDPDSAQTPTSDAKDAFKRIDENNAPVKRRFLYPDFNKYEELDGNPYFQMNGGWMSKTVQNCKNMEECTDESRYNFQYDVDDNIAYTCYVPKGSDEDDKVIDNHPLYKETLRNIRRVDSIGDLISTPSNEVDEGSIFYVTNVENGVAIVDNEVFNIKYEYSGDEEKPYRYISLIKEYDYIKIGDDKFFTSSIVVYNKDNEETSYSLSDKDNGYEVKAYIRYKDSDEDETPQFVCKANTDGVYTIDSFMILDDEVTSATTNYFIIDNPYYSNRLATKEVDNGWRRLNDNDQEYIKINTIINYYEGNNPHNGNMRYDSGHEYLSHFNKLFKYPIDNELFDERCYESYYYYLDNEISKYGFSNLVHNNYDIKQYFPYISGLTDTKIHYFGSYYKIGYDEEDNSERTNNSALTECNTVMFYGEDSNKAQSLEKMYQCTLNSGITVSSYTLSDSTEESDGNNAYNLSKGMIGGTPYTLENMVDIESEKDIDDVTNQIVNNKRLTIKFNIHGDWFSKEGQSEIKYLDTIVMNYLTQMIPSTTIFDVQYIGDGIPTKTRWTSSGTMCVGYDLYEKLIEEISFDGGEKWNSSGKKKPGKLIQTNSIKCGYKPDPEPEPIEPSGELVFIVSGETCSGTSLYQLKVGVIMKEGTILEVTSETELGDLIEEDSPTCSEINPSTKELSCTGGTVDFKIKAKNSD